MIHKIYRSELKLIYTSIEEAYVRNLVDNLVGIHRQHPDRRISSIYFDTNKLDSAKDNITGISQRIKYRYRYYDNDIEFGKLEKKIKNNKLGTKEYFDIKNINSSSSASSVSEFINEFNRNMQPYRSITKISYFRSYFANNKIRVTIDTDIHFTTLEEKECLSKEATIFYPYVILELKFDPSKINELKNYILALDKTPSRHSKYLASLSKLGLTQYI